MLRNYDDSISTPISPGSEEHSSVLNHQETTFRVLLDHRVTRCVYEMEDLEILKTGQRKHLNV